MTTDFENELRDLFREKAGEAPLASPTLPASAPPRVLRRGRLHQAGTILGSAVVVVALIVGSVAGLTRILGEGDDIVGSDNYEVFQRTATIEGTLRGRRVSARFSRQNGCEVTRWELAKPLLAL